MTQKPQRRIDDFFSFVEKNDQVAVKSMLDASTEPIDKDAFSSGGKTALMISATHGHTGMMDLLIKRKASLDICSKSPDCWTALFYAAASGHFEATVKLLESGASTQIRDADGASSLMIAASSSRSNTAVVEALLQFGADVNAHDKDKCTALMMTAQTGSLGMLTLLLRWKAAVNACDKDGSRPLMYAAANGRDSVVELLLRAGASINAQDKDGWTALIDAARSGKPRAVEVLLKAGAKISVMSKSGKSISALTYAANKETADAINRAIQPGFRILPPFPIDFGCGDLPVRRSSSSPSIQSDDQISPRASLPAQAVPSISKAGRRQRSSRPSRASTSALTQTSSPAAASQKAAAMVTPLNLSSPSVIAQQQQQQQPQQPPHQQSRASRSWSARSHGSTSDLNENKNRESAASDLSNSSPDTPHTPAGDRTSPPFHSMPPTPLSAATGTPVLIPLQSFVDGSARSQSAPAAGSPSLAAAQQPSAATPPPLPSMNSRPVLASSSFSYSTSSLYAFQRRANEKAKEVEEKKNDSSSSSSSSSSNRRVCDFGDSNKSNTQKTPNNGTANNTATTASSSTTVTSSSGTNNNKKPDDDSDDDIPTDEERKRASEARNGPEANIGIPKKDIPQPSGDADRKQMNDDAVAALAAAGVAAGAVSVGVLGAAETAKVALRFAPVFTALFLTIRAINTIITDVLANKDNCRYMARRCVSMKPILEEIQANFNPTRENVETLAVLVDEFDKTLELIKKYTDAGWLRKVISASSWKADFLNQDRKLTSLVSDLTMGMQNRTLQTLIKHVPYVEVKLDEIQKELASFRGEVTTEMKELKDLVRQLIESRGGGGGGGQPGDDSLVRSSSSRVLKMAQQLTKDELDEKDVETLYSYCNRTNRIGKGSFGTVYKGYFRGTEVAIKELDVADFHVPSDADSDRQPGRAGGSNSTGGKLKRAVDDFKQEVALLRLLHSSRLVQFIGACTRPPNLIIVTEFCEGGSLHRFIRSQQSSSSRRLLRKSSTGQGGSSSSHQCDPEEDKRMIVQDDAEDVVDCLVPMGDQMLNNELRLRLATQIALGLNVLHQHNPPIVHRDLKSRNVLLDEYGNAKICDFGLSRTMTHSALSTVNGSVGTPQYMSPEALRAQPLTPKADVYSFGILLLELFTGIIPWENLNLVQIVTRVLVEKERVVVPPTVPKDVAAIILACLESDVSKRPDIGTVVRQLRKVKL